jgi:hypothetical protein
MMAIFRRFGKTVQMLFSACGTPVTLFLRKVLQLLLTSNVFPISLFLFALMMEAIRSSET